MNNAKQQNNLYDQLLGLEDFRRAEGKMHELRLILIIVIMAIMSGFYGLRAMGDFVKKNRKELIELFKTKNGRLPSRQTIGRALQHLDFNKFNNIFYHWAINYVDIEDKDWISIDGKAIRGTVSNSGNSLQDFTSLVSVFVSKKKQTITVGKINHGKEGEIPKVQDLIKLLGLEGMVFTLDALHCQAKTVKTIIAFKNDYCIGVKGNQKKLHEQIKKKHSSLQTNKHQ
jgi:hypothetical protein